MTQQTASTISLQFLAPGDDGPTRNIDLTGATLTLPPGANLPRVGEFFHYEIWGGPKTVQKTQYVVLALNTVLVLHQDEVETVGWNTVITVGPLGPDTDEKLSRIAA